MSTILRNTQYDHLKSVFEQAKRILALQRPPNLISLLTNAKFNSELLSQINRLEVYFFVLINAANNVNIIFNPLIVFKTPNGTVGE